MKQGDSLREVPPGSPSRPGPIGRIARFALGLLCCYGLYQLVLYRESIIQTPVTTLPDFAVLIVVALLIISDVVNIGLGRGFGRRPAYLSLIAGAALAGFGWWLFDTPDHPLLGVPLWLWLLYFYGHLGSSFLLAAVLATPGCEMRAIPELVGRLTGRTVQGHHCPVAFVRRIDAWESRRA